MRRRISYILLSVGVLVGVLLLLVYFSTHTPYGVLEGRVTDEVSGDVVRRVRLNISDRTDILFNSKEFRFTNLPPGRYELMAEAPYYEPVREEFEINRGINTFDISMRGLEIPDLDGIICFTSSIEEGIEIEIRFRNTQGRGITDYPALPLELEGTLYHREGTRDEYTLGNVLFEGDIDLFWDPEAHLARNKGLIPWDAIDTEREGGTHGVLKLVLHTPQGSFEDQVRNVELARKEEYM